MSKIILNSKNKLRISTVLLSTIIISCLFMIFGENKGYDVNDNLGDIYETRDYVYTVEFIDAGYEYNRPNTMKFGLYKGDSQSPESIVVLERNKCRRATCTITFKDIQEKDENDNIINYAVKEIGDYGYNVTYDGDHIINEANMKNVKIDILDKDNHRVLNSILAIKDSSDKEILTLTTGVDLNNISLLRGQYTLVEKDSPKGYKRFKDVTFKVLDDGNLEINGTSKEMITVNKEDINIKINLVNEYGDIIPDIKIELTDLTNGNITKTSYTGATDIDVNKEIDVDSEYSLKQLKEAFEYLNAKEVKFSFDKDNRIIINNEVLDGNRVLLVVHPAYYHITVDKKIEGNIKNTEVFTFNINIEGYNGIITTSKGDLNFNDGNSSFTLIPNEEIIIKVPTYSKYTITEETDYDNKIEGNNSGEVLEDIKVTFINTYIEEEIIVPAPITGINKIAYLLTSLLLVLLGFLVTLYYKKKHN